MNRMRIRLNESASFLPMERRAIQPTDVRRMANGTILVEGDVRVDDVDRVLPCDGEEYACRSDPSVVELSLNCGFDSHNSEAVPLSSIDRMAVRVPGEAVQGAALDVVAESLLVVQDVPHDQSCVDDVGRIGSCRVGSATVSTVK